MQFVISARLDTPKSCSNPPLATFAIRLRTGAPISRRTSSTPRSMPAHPPGPPATHNPPHDAHAGCPPRRSTPPARRTWSRYCPARWLGRVQNPPARHDAVFETALTEHHRFRRAHMRKRHRRDRRRGGGFHKMSARNVLHKIETRLLDRSNTPQFFPAANFDFQAGYSLVNSFSGQSPNHE